MIKIEIKKSQMINENISAFISFQYNEEILIAVKSLAIRKYHPKDKCWETKVKYIDELKKKLPDKSFIIKDYTKSIIKIPDGYVFKSAPMAHQIECVEFGLNNPKILIGDEQGLGKTAESLYIAEFKKKQHNYQHTLIICCVNKLKWNWQKEVEMHTFEKAHIIGSRYTKTGKPKPISTKEKLEDITNIQQFSEHHFLITNMESFRDDEFTDRIRYLCSTGAIGTIIVDEIHKCKNPKSKTADNLLKISAENIISLSGTILINDPIDLYFPLKFLGVETMEYWAFRNEYLSFKSLRIKDKETGKSRMIKIPVGHQNLDDLHRKLDHIKIRRKKEDVLNLPDKIHIKEFLEMSDQQRKIYDEIKDSLLKEVDLIEICRNPLEKMTRLRQATTMPSLVTSSDVDSCKLERMKEIIEEAVINGRKTIVFSNWEKVVDKCMNELKEYKPAKITGTIFDPEQEKDRFMNDDECMVILGTIGAMGTGYTLTAASNVIFMDTPWTYADKQQAEDRAHRIGTKESVNIYTLLCQGTVDEKIEEIVEGKKTFSDLLIDMPIEELKTIF